MLNWLPVAAKAAGGWYRKLPLMLPRLTLPPALICGRVAPETALSSYCAASRPWRAASRSGLLARASRTRLFSAAEWNSWYQSSAISLP